MIIYKTEALDDLERLREWLLKRSAIRAEAKFLALLKLAQERIASTPHAWPVAADGATRRYLMRFGQSNYVIHYLEDGPDQIIIRIWHGREDRG